MPQALNVFYRHSPRGENELAFAVDFLEQAGFDRLVLLLQEDPAFAQVMDGGGSEQRERLSRSILQRYSQISPAALSIKGYSPDEAHSPLFLEPGLLINRRPDLRVDYPVPVLVPCDEAGLCQRGKGPMLIPFGDGVSAFRSARVALPLAKTLGLKVVFYHTSWKNSNIDSDDPRDHICASARRTQAQLESDAGEMGVVYQTVIETTDDTVEGIVHCAMRFQCRLIALAKRIKPGIGCYVNLALKKSPVPLLIVGKTQGGAL
ncbi:MAG: universal stress protein [Candidatus Obscuribacterales bacterium]|nr:universal stress protein [Candidatus Obscuribacterales bacterium]